MDCAYHRAIDIHRSIIACAAATLLVTLHVPTVLAQQHYELSDGQWELQQSYPPESPEGRLQAIRKAMARGDADRAQDLADRWLEHYPDHPLRVEALLLRGDAKAAQREYYDALYDYEAIIRLYPASEQFYTALEREYEIARLFTQGVNRDFLGMPILPAESEGEELLIRVQERAPGSAVGEKASLTLADYYFEKGRMDLAAEAYDIFLENYPDSRQREWAMLRLIQASLARFRGPAYDPTGLIDAAQRLRMYRDAYPAAADRIGADALLVRIEESLATKDLITARWYRVRDKPVSAAFVFRRIVKQYPQTAAAQQAMRTLEQLDVPLEALP